MKTFIDKTKNAAIKILDRNDDGEFNKNDITDTVEVIKKNINNTSKDLELRKLKPIFENDITSSDFAMTKLIRVTDMDKKHADSELCINSIGHVYSHKDYDIVNIYRDNLDAFDLTFYPNSDGDFYYVDPTDPTRFIDLDEYFYHLKAARVQELQRVAQDLGAKYFQVTLKEELTSFSKSNKKAGVKVKPIKASVDAEQNTVKTSSAKTNIEASMRFTGHEPIRPELKYLKNDPVIEGLIESRMHKLSPMTNQSYSVQLSNSVGMKEKDAVKIDAAIKALKLASHVTVASEVERESKRTFIFEIEF